MSLDSGESLGNQFNIFFTKTKIVLFCFPILLLCLSFLFSQSTCFLCVFFFIYQKREIIRMNMWKGVVLCFGDSWVDHSGLAVVIWVNDPSIFPFWVDDPVWVGDPEDVVVAFLVIGSGRASRTSFPFVLDLPPLPEELDTLGGIGNFL